MGDSEQRRWEETAAAVAHELGTPLAVAQASLQALVGALGDERSVALAETALRSIRAMELQVGRLRRLEGASGHDLWMERVDLVELTRRLIDDLDVSLLHDHPTDVEGPDRLEAMVDPDQIRQVLYNLLSNAAKYSPSGREIVVGLACTDDEIVLQVRDRGDGVAPADAERIFGKYERAGAAVPGAGLGLFLSRLVVESHGGSLHLVPAQDEGAVFEIRLPRAGSPEAPDER